MNNYHSHLIIRGQSKFKGNLWLGNLDSAKDHKTLNQKDIFYVITVGLGMKVSYDKSFNHQIYPVHDNEHENLSIFFQDSYKWIEECLKKGNILIHCFAGISRSASIVIAYMMRKNKWNFNKAFNEVQKCRQIIKPNKGFVKQLLELEVKLKQMQRQVKQTSKTKSSLEFANSIVNYKGKKRSILFNPIENYERTKNKIIQNIRNKSEINPPTLSKSTKKQ